MKNPSMAKLAKMAGSNRVAMKMKMEEKAAAKMKREAAMKLKKESMAKQRINPFGEEPKYGPYKEGLEKKEELPPTIKAPKKSFKQAYKDRDMKIYGDLTFDEYKTEAKRQIESKKQGKGFDAPKKPMVSKSKKNQSTTTTTTTTTTPTDTKKDDKTTTTTPTETKKKKGKFLKDTKVGKEFRRFGQSLKNLLTKKKPSATKMKKKSAMEMKKEAAMKMKKKAAMKMKKAPAKMKKASMAKLNPGFDKLPKEVQAKILKNKKK